MSNMWLVVTYLPVYINQQSEVLVRYIANDLSLQRVDGLKTVKHFKWSTWLMEKVLSAWMWFSSLQVNFQILCCFPKSHCDVESCYSFMSQQN